MHRSTGGEQGRRSSRTRQVSQRMAVVDDDTRQQAAKARLDALEKDNDQADAFAADEDDDEFGADSDSDEAEFAGRKRKRKGASAKRKTRGMMSDRKGPKSFARLLEEVSGSSADHTLPTYLAAGAAPSKAYAARKFCSVCGSMSGYTCPRCGSKYCSRKCYTVHSETRCLKFMA